jgi:hypothetical protein
MDTKMVIESDYFGTSMTGVQEGADAVEYLASATDLKSVTGEYFSGKQKARANPQAYDAEARRHLWALSEHIADINKGIK